MPSKKSQVMHIDDILPHLNKIATLYLKNHKRKVGWIFLDQPANEISPDEVFFISVQKGKKHQGSLEKMDHGKLQEHCEVIPIVMIERIRSSK
jgi:hypothetical protein